MAQYRYQTDFGGIGGTTRRGTITKLGMAGLLMHHETANKDFFDHKMEPWVRYIPVDWSLNHLKQQCDWAQSHPTEASAISDRATELHHYLLSADYMDELHEELFVQYLGSVAERYVPSLNLSWGQQIAEYAEKGFTMQRVGYCHLGECHFNGQGESVAIPGAVSGETD